MNFRVEFLIFWLSYWGVTGEICEDIDPSDPNYLIEIPDDCYSFIKCSNRKAYVMRCPKGTVFNKNVCDWPWNTHRKCGPEPTWGPTGTPTGTATWQPRTPTVTSSSRTGTPTPPVPRNCSDVDPSDPNYLIEIPDDCYHFIMCSNRRAIVMACPVGTVFNPKNSICDWPWNAGRDCGPTSTPRPTPTPTGTSSQRTSTPTTPGTSSQRTTPTTPGTSSQRTSTPPTPGTSSQRTSTPTTPGTSSQRTTPPTSTTQDPDFTETIWTETIDAFRYTFTLHSIISN